ncbi:MAG: AAA family ATPase [Anaerolineales bacterium]
MELDKILPQDENSSKPRFYIRDAKYALEYQVSLEYIVDRLITSGSVSVVFGEGGSKKTYSLLSLAVCVAIGQNWLGFDVKPRKVLICDEESGEQRLSLRLGAAIRGVLADENIPINYMSLQGLQLDDRKDADALQALIIEIDAGLVIIDSLSATTSGDENSKEFIQPVFSNLRRIAEATQAAIIVIHHVNKTGAYRGSTAIKNSVDLLLKIESESNSNWINFRSEKVRDGEAISFSAVATWNDADQFYLSPAEHRLTEKINPSQQYVLEYLKKNGPSPLPEIKERADVCSPRAAENAVYALARKGLIYRTNKEDSGRGVVAIYNLTKENDEEMDYTLWSPP